MPKTGGQLPFAVLGQTAQTVERMQTNLPGSLNLCSRKLDVSVSNVMEYGDFCDKTILSIL